MALQIPVDDSLVYGRVLENGLTEIAADLAYLRVRIANVAFHGPSGGGDRSWTLIDAGVAGSEDAIVKAAEQRFGRDARPGAIVMTHGHFDHVGVLEQLAERWDAPIYAHALERPYLDGSASYPPADPWVGGGLVALLSPLFPTRPVNVASRLRDLDADGSVPGMPGWRWVHTPGHSPGHVSLWRASDRAIIAGDAFVTTGQESVYEVMLQKPEMHGPPRYFTPDWRAAKQSVVALAALRPDLVITGHGPALKGPAVAVALRRLADEFESIALPRDRSAQSSSSQ